LTSAGAWAKSWKILISRKRHEAGGFGFAKTVFNPATYFGLRAARRTRHALILLVLGMGVLAPSSRGQTNGNELDTVAAIRALSVAETGQHIPVKLRGVVTFFDEQLFSHFIQDDTAGIYLKYPTNVAPDQVYPGQLVEVTGTCSPGEYAPVVLINHLEVVGTAPLPPAKAVTYEQMTSGAEDSQFVEISGIVRSFRKLVDSDYNQIEIATGGGRLTIYARELPVTQGEELLDSTVQVRGVCSTKFNRNRQLFAMDLMVPRKEDLVIVIPAPMNPFATPAHPIGSLLQFAPQETFGHRVKIEGTVIYDDPGKTIYLQYGEEGVEVQTLERDPLRLGDRVEALGFVSQGEYTPYLQDAIYKKISAGPVPEPVNLTTDEVLKGNHDCRLIQVAGRVLDRTQHGMERYLILQDGDFIFHAYLNTFAGIPNGSRVAVTGVCEIDPGEWQAGDAWRAKGFSILLRSMADVKTLQAPSWWTLRRVLWMAGALSLATLAAFAWVAVLRRQVTERTRQLEIQIQERQRAERRQEIEQERARLAHDLHDDLGAGLTEVNMLSSLVKSQATSTAEKEAYLTDLSGATLRMVTSLDEIVWAVNPRNDTIASLASYFASYAQRLLNLAGVTCGLDIADDLPDRALDPKFRQQLFFAFKESLSNVVRHAYATQVWLHISVSQDQLWVEVGDNGRGFEPAQPPAGCDGLANMKERLKKLGGQCIIVSDSQNGTSVRFLAPLPEALL
jgi:signal transduction histidine kinase